MGCFSYICKGCGTGINSTYFRGATGVEHKGERCELYLLLGGKVIEHLSGAYDSYGRVKGADWSMDWGDICDLQFTDNPAEGIAAYHTRCNGNLVPTEKSKNDPNQGWGKVRKKYL